MFPQHIKIWSLAALFFSSIISAIPSPAQSPDLTMSKVKPFKLEVPQSELVKLKLKLAAISLPGFELENGGWEYGSPMADVNRFVKYWRDEFDWRKAEKEINSLPQFTTKIKIDGFDEIDLHFIHAKSPKKNAIPLLFAHGWPGSFDEITKSLPFLLDGGDQNPSFDVIAPSMPNFAFSSKVSQQGFGYRQTAEVFHKLMTEALGYPEYVTQGGDAGYHVTRQLAFKHPESVKASHYNLPQPREPTKDFFPEVFAKYNSTTRTQEELDGFARSQWFVTKGMGYYGIQSTKPQTIGYSLADSPAGLMAWVYEKLHDWTDAYPWTPYEVCKWVSIYWFSKAGPAATLFMYYDLQNNPNPDGSVKILNEYLKGPKIGCTVSPKEIAVLPLVWNEVLGDLVFNKKNKRGGHFYSFEQPEELAKDLRAMFGKQGGAYGVVKDRSGYA